jgi:hypothetical protein
MISNSGWTGIVIRDFKPTRSPSAFGSHTPHDKYETDTLWGKMLQL